jgi:Bacteriophage tail sheath protein
MPIAPTYPGVYIEEIPSGVRTIMGVSTSVAAFVDFFRRGPMNKAVQVLSFGDFERAFGGLDKSSEASYAIQQFFLNGGTEAWVVRVASGTIAKADVQIADGAPGGAALTVFAIEEGTWGNSLRVRVDPAPAAGEFNLIVSQVNTSGSRAAVVRQEVFRNLSVDKTKVGSAEKVVNDALNGSKLVRVSITGTSPPLATGTFSAAHAVDPTLSANPQVSVTIDGKKVDVPLRFPSGTTFPAKVPLKGLAQILQASIRAADPASPAFAEATVEVVGDRLRVLAGAGDPKRPVTFALAGSTAAAELMLAPVTKPTVTLSGENPGGTATLSAAANPKVDVTIGAVTATATLSLPGGTVLPGPVSLAVLAEALEDAIHAADSDAGFTGARVGVADTRLVVLSGGSASAATFAVSGADVTADEMHLTATEGATSLVATVSAQHAGDPMVSASPKVNVTVGTSTLTVPISFGAVALPGAVPRASLAGALQTALRAAKPGDNTFDRALVSLVDNHLVVLPGTNVTMEFANAQSAAATELLLAGATANVQEYVLGAGAVAGTAQTGGTAGADGAVPDATALIGDEVAKTGIHALNDVDLVNLLALPRAASVGGDPTDLNANQAKAVLAKAQAYCEKRRAFLLVDTPKGVDEPSEVRDWLAGGGVARTKNSALFYPRVQIPDPLDDFRLRSVGASGTIAGLFARIDSTRGVWKAPAGTEASLRNVAGFDDALTDPENGVLNPLGINCLRNLPVYGPVCWGARTLEGSDQQASEWKYVPVRRLALFIEESLFRGTQWVVFEPNDEPLWAQIRLNVGAFMHNLFRQGAFQGKSPREAYFVKCDRETTTQNEVDQGIVNVVVGFAPLKPAEFVIIKLQQMAGQILA